jgi:hypothetical protein
MSAVATMPAGTVKLVVPDEVAERLRSRFPTADDDEWAVRVAIDEGWEESNSRYLRWQRIKGRLEMEALMAALGVSKSESAGMASGLTSLASSVFDDGATPESVKGARKYLRQGWRDATGVGGKEEDG